MFWLYFPNQDECKLLMIFPAKQFSCFLPCSSGPSWFSPLPNLFSREKHTSTIYRNICKEIAAYKEYNENARLQMKYVTTNCQDLSLCFCRVFVFAFVFVSQQYSRRRRPASQALGGFVVRLSSPAISYMHCSCPKDNIYMKYMFDVFFVQQYLVLLLHCP